MAKKNTKPYYPTKTRQEYQRKYPKAHVILDLEEKSLKLPASKWGKQHLIACRVLNQSGGKILPMLKEFAPEPNGLENHKEWANIKPLIEGPPKEDLQYKSRLELEHEHGNLGTLWSTLAKIIAPREANDPKEYPQREEKPVRTEEFVSTEDMRILSSSPVEEASAGTSQKTSQQSFKLGSLHGSEVDEEEHVDRTRNEVLAVNLAGAFIRYVLNFCAEQNPAKDALLEFQEEPCRRTDWVSKLRIDATDDGGIWVVEKREGKSPWTWKRRLALLEAKRAFQRIDNGNRPGLSDDNLAQYTCEALTECLGPSISDEVFVVTMTQTFMGFLNYHRTEEYMEYLRSTDVKQQKASAAYLSVTETEFFALDSEDGRRNAVCNLLGLVKFWEQVGEDGTMEIEGMEGMEGSGEEVESNPAFDDADGDDADYDSEEEIDEDDSDDYEHYDLRPRKRKRYSS